MTHVPNISFEIINDIGIISLGNPPSNKLEQPEFIPLEQFHEWIQDESVKALIITGEGKNFSSGGNLKEIFHQTQDPERLAFGMNAGKELLEAINDLLIPSIAAINRVCFGGGLEIALACHIRVASENALLAFPEINSNLMPGLGGTIRLPEIIGLSQATRVILGGDIVNASDAKSMGLVDFLAQKDHAFEYAFSLARKMTIDRPVKVINAIMKSLKNAATLSPTEAMKDETRLFCMLAINEAERRKMEGE
ncbi:MAG: enoyl-CoA hydratase/isomerase family protein [Bacteroidales bacterium]|nr:enoyl-CoA hydratase/isomerase family protein [Bacteroidales bacterium]